MSDAAKVAAASMHRSGSVGMAIFVASDAATFAGLLAAYAVLRSRAESWGAGEPALAVAPAVLATLALLASSGALEVARRQRLSARAATPALAAAAALGGVFVVIQFWEWRALAGAGLALASGSAFAASYYVLTGFHGLHVLAGVGYLGALLAARAPATALTTAGIYWHFVGAIWLCIFAALYLI